LGGLGIENYGIYILILGFVGYSFTFGIGKAAGKYVAQFKAEKNWKALSEAVSAVLLISSMIGIFAAFIFWMLSRTIVTNIFLIPTEKVETATVSLQIAGIIIAVTMISIVYQNILQGLQRFDRFVPITIVYSVLLNLGAVAVVLAGGGVKALLLSNLAAVVITAFAFFFTARRLLPELSFNIVIRPEIRNKVLRYSSSIVLYQIFGNALYLLERSILVRQFGPESVSYYAIPLSLTLFFLGFASSFTLAVFPVANELMRNQERSRDLYRLSTKAMFSISCLFVGLTILFGSDFLRLWLGEEFSEYSSLLLIIHSCSIALTAIASIAWHFAEANERYMVNAIVTFSLLVVAGSLMLTYGQIDGMEGIAFSRLLGSTVFVFLIVYFERAMYGSVDVGYWLSASLQIGLAVVLVGGGVVLSRSLFDPSWPYVFTAAGMGTLVYLMLLWAFGYLNERERNLATDLVSNIFRRRRTI
jgi:O-antigen/teichoic acid export membrane protein